MSQFRFQVLEMRYSTPQEWLSWWAKRYDYKTDYDPEYRALIEKHKSFSAEDFRRIGKWKDGATTEVQWKPNVASVAYLIWERAAKKLPKCPEVNQVQLSWRIGPTERTRTYLKMDRGRNTLGCPARRHYSISSAEGSTLSSTRG